MRPRRTDARARHDRAALRAANALVAMPYETTVQFAGGPVIPMRSAADAVLAVRDAVQKIHGAAAREAAAAQPQTDLEECTGVAEDQKAREAEAGGIAADRLRSIVERIERLEEERRALASDKKDILSEAKSAGFEIKPLRRLLQERRREPAEVEEENHLLDLYKRALGM
jgi:uncharacterized protein (UPF0335 family)